MRLNQSETLASLEPEKNVRRARGSSTRSAYVCEDRVSRSVIIAQKLSDIAAFLNDAAGPLYQDRISVSCLYRSLSIKDSQGKTGGWAKHRFRIRSLPLDAAVLRFEALRDTYDTPIVLGKSAVATQFSNCK